MDGFTFHALGNAREVRDLFEGIVRITGDGDYAVAAALLVTVGFILVLAAGAVRADGKNVIPYFASAVLFWCAAVVPTATVVIHDNRSESVYTVDNVPLSVALTASLATTVVGGKLRNGVRAGDVSPFYALRGGVSGTRGGSSQGCGPRDARSEASFGHGGVGVRRAGSIGGRRQRRSAACLG